MDGGLEPLQLENKRRLRAQSPTSVEAGAEHQARSARLCCEADGGALPRWRQRPRTHFGVHGLRTKRRTVNPTSRTPIPLSQDFNNARVYKKTMSCDRGSRGYGAPAFRPAGTMHLQDGSRLVV
jgi:hypothetical protein